MFERLRRLFRRQQESRTIHIEDVMEFYTDMKGETLDELRDEASARREDVEDALDDLEDSLEVLKSHEGENARVDDVTTNVASRRERNIDRFDPPEDLEEFTEAARQLTDDLSTVTQKEKAVLDHIGEAADQVFNQVRDVEDAVEELERFLTEQYSPVKTYQDLEELLDQRQQLEKEKQELLDDIDAIDIGDLTEQIQETEQDLAELADDPEQEEREQLIAEKDELQDRIDELEHSIEQAVSGMERGLRKLLYEAESGSIDLDDDIINVLHDIKEDKILEDDTDPGSIHTAVKAASEAITEIEIGERQLERFRDAADDLGRIGETRQQIEDLEEKINDLDEEIDDLTIQQRRDEIQEKREDLIEEKKAQKREQDQLEHRLGIKIDALEETLAEIEQLLDDVLYDDITVVDDRE